MKHLKSVIQLRVLNKLARVINPIERSTIEELLKRSHDLSSAHTKAVKRYMAAKDHSTYTSRSSITEETR